MLTESQANNHLRELMPRSPWDRSNRGNLTMMIRHLRLTVFEQHKGGGCYRWSVADASGDVLFSPGSYPSERAAVEAATAVVQEAVEEWEAER